MGCPGRTLVKGIQWRLPAFSSLVQGRRNAIKSGAARGVIKTRAGPTDLTRTNRVNKTLFLGIT